MHSMSKIRIVPPRSSERGSTMIMTAILMLGLLMCVGLCIDISRLYMTHTELKNAADAAALAAARELNSGTSGIDNAVTRANAIVNNYGLNPTAVTISAVEFAVNLNGTYVNAATARNAPTNIRFVRVTTAAVSTTMLFSSAALGGSLSNTGQSVAGMSVGLNTICDFFPVAVALTDINPAPNTTMTLTFTQGTNNSATLVDKNYIVLEVPDINGNGSPETAVLSAGLTSICQKLNVNVPFHMTPSANQNNGPRQITDGINTRFNIYANGYGNALVPSTYPPDSNVQENITFDQYNNKTAVTPPNPNAPGKDQRRILIVPIVAPGTYTGTPVGAPTLKFGAFFLKSQSTVSNPCSQGGPCGNLSVEWIDERLVIGNGGFDPGGGTSSLTVPVLYK
jgi:Flp pilus assembly protein TadG